MESTAPSALPPRRGPQKRKREVTPPLATPNSVLPPEVQTGLARSNITTTTTESVRKRTTEEAQHSLTATPSSESATPALATSTPAAATDGGPSATFEVMLNHTRVKVDRRHPFLNPTSLFTAADTTTAASVGAVVGNSLDGRADLCPPLHRYGHRPVLLLDYTGVSRLHKERTGRRAAVEADIEKLLEEREGQMRKAQVYHVRRQRARLPPPPAVTSSSSTATEEKEEEEEKGEKNDATATRKRKTRRRRVDGGVVRSEAFYTDLIRTTAARRNAISRQLTVLRKELKVLRGAKQIYTAPHDGQVLLLPSPSTGAVRLCPGHHYKTVCFVGEEVRDIIPGEGPVPQPPPSPSSEDAVRRLSEAVLQTNPQWLAAEVAAFKLLRRRREMERGVKRQRGESARSEITAPLEFESEEDRESLRAYLALPACEAATLRALASYLSFPLDS